MEEKHNQFHEFITTMHARGVLLSRLIELDINVPEECLDNLTLILLRGNVLMMKHVPPTDTKTMDMLKAHADHDPSRPCWMIDVLNLPKQ